MGEPIREWYPQMKVERKVLMGRLDEVASPDTRDLARELTLALMGSTSPLCRRPIRPPTLGFGQRDMLDHGIGQHDVELAVVKWQSGRLLQLNESQTDRLALDGEIEDVRDRNVQIGLMQKAL